MGTVLSIKLLGHVGARPFPGGRMEDESMRRPTSKSLSVSSCLLVLRVNRPERGWVFFTTEHTERVENGGKKRREGGVSSVCCEAVSVCSVVKTEAGEWEGFTTDITDTGVARYGLAQMGGWQSV